MEKWFSFTVLDVILSTVAFCTVVLAVGYIYAALKWHRAQKRATQKDSKTINLAH